MKSTIARDTLENINDIFVRMVRAESLSGETSIPNNINQ